MVVSLIFWLCLLVAAILFGLVSLAPKYSVYLQLRSKFDVNQRKLVALEAQTEELSRVVHALENDKEFVAELTRMEFDAVGPGEEVIPVDDELRLNANKMPSTADDPAPIHEWYEPYVTYLASNGTVRMSLLATAAVLVIISFTLLPPAGPATGTENSSRQGSLWHTLRSRYVRQSSL